MPIGLPADRLAVRAAIGGRGPASEDGSARPLSLYLHVPYCAARCGYCDFNTYPTASLGATPGAGQDAYLAAVRAELDRAVGALGDRVVSTVFVGGGTPTVLPPGELAGLLGAIRERFELAADAEVTTEANPETLNRAYADELAAAGFTRLSLGMQSAVPAVLATLGRRHTPGRVADAVGWARAAGFASVSVDLIYASPGESAADWRTSLDAAVALGVDHVSAYCLTIEPGTPLAARVARGELAPADDETQAAFYAEADRVLAAAGYRWYEVSNWARPGAACRHNLAYWRSGDWWGVGPGAHSHVDGVRWWNVRHPRDYTARLADGRGPAAGGEVLDDDQRHAERVLLELRLADGLPIRALTPTERARVPAYVARGWLAVDPDVAAAGVLSVADAASADPRLRLTLQGRLMADALVRDLLD